MGENVQYADTETVFHAEMGTNVKYGDGEVVFEKGSDGREVYFILDGKAEVSHYLFGEKEIVAILEEGEFFGEMAAISDDARSMTITAIGDLHLRELSLDDTLQYMHAEPAALKNVFTSLVGRLRNTNRKVEELTLREPNIRALLNGGILSMEQLESALDANSRSHKPVEEILMEFGRLSNSELKKAMELGEIEEKETHEVLIERRVISQSDLQMARERQRNVKESLTKTLVDLEYADEDSILVCYALQLGIPYIPLTQFPLRKQFAGMLSSRLAYRYTVVPIDLASQTIVIAASEPLNENARLDIEEETGKRVMLILAKRLDIEEMLRKYYSDKLPLAKPFRGSLVDQNRGAIVNA